MSKVYIITGTDHDDHELYGAFSSKEKAEAYVKFHNGWMQLEEMEVW